MPSRCLMVLSVPRAGSSCVAGVLHRLGIDMGQGHFQPNDWANPRGYYEDLRWRLATQHVTGRGYSLRAANLQRVGKAQRQRWRALARGDAHKLLWGMKDPWLAFVGRFVWPILEHEGVQVRLVVVTRARAASVASVQRHLDRTYKGKGNAPHIVDTWQAGLDRQIAAWAGRGPSLLLPYADLVREPRTKAQYLADFAYEGLGRPPAGAVDTAAAWVDPRLNHHKGAQ